MFQPLEPRRLFSVSFDDNLLLVDESDQTAGQTISVALRDSHVIVTESAPDQLVPTTRGFAVPDAFRVLVVAGGGDDTIDLSGLQVPGGMTTPATVFGGAGNDTIVGGAAADSLSGGSGDDLVEGGGGNDTVSGDAGDDTLRGGQGNDSLAGGDGDDLLSGGSTVADGTNLYDGADTLSGGAGLDTADYSGRSEDLVITLDGLANDGAPATAVPVSFKTGPNSTVVYETDTGPGSPAEADDVEQDVETVIGGSGNDAITADSGPTFDSPGFIDVGAGHNPFPSPDPFALIGGPGNDTLFDNAGADTTLRGGAGDDLLQTQFVGLNLFAGGSGDDTIDFSHVAASMRVTLDAQPGNAQNVFPTDGHLISADTVAGDVENVIGSVGNDTLIGNAADNRLTGNVGKDVIEGLGGNDTLRGGNGDDTLYGGAGADSLAGGAGDDQLHAVDGTAADTLDGGLGDNAAFADSHGGAEDVLKDIQSPDLTNDVGPIAGAT